MTEREDDAPKEIEKPESLDKDANEGPFEKHEEDAPDETDGAPHLLLAREEVERLVGPNDEREP